MIDLDVLRPYWQLERAALLMARQLDLDVVVRQLPRSLEGDRRGDCDRRTRVIRLARRAPLSTVCHELAHLLVPGDDHGDEWLVMFLALAQRVRSGE